MPLSPSLSKLVEIHPDNGAIAQNDLSRIFLSNATRDIHKWHHYFEIYERWFTPFRTRSDLRMLEIGVLNGGSLKLWRRYFDPGAKIIGLDINPDCKRYEDAARNIFIEIGDQADPDFLARVLEKHGPFDIILDDGGHMTAQQTTSFNELYAGLSDGGVYMVEDLYSNYWPAFLDSDQSFIDFAKGLIDRLHEPYVGHESRKMFRMGHEQQIDSALVSEFCANTSTISFYDSVIVFKKHRKSLPVAEKK